MISEPTYLAAKMVSHRIVAHFEKQVSLRQNTEGRHIPDRPIVEALIDTAFWASLRREEGQEPKISLAFLPPDMADNSVIFHHKQRFSPYNLVKLSPAVIQPGIHLGIWMEGDNLCIWGTTNRSEEHTSELQSLMRISYAVFCLKKQ